MIEKIYSTRCGDIHYYVNDFELARANLVFLPGLTADHRLFDKQIEYFESKCNVFVWDAPGHAASWPFVLDFDLKNKALWLDEILEEEGMKNPILIGQSMGGYVSQAYLQYCPGKARGFICIDSAPLQRVYLTALELWALKNVGPIYKIYPWKSLLKAGSKGVATTEYGRQLMFDMMMVYDGDQDRYAKLSGHGFRILAEAIELDLPYEITCPTILICGEKDAAGSAKSYNKRWHAHTGLPILWLKNAGHNSNTDCPKKVNRVIEELVSRTSN